MENTTPSIITEAVSELIGLGASMAANCEPCFRYHYDRATKLGVSQDDMLQAVNLAMAVKAAPHRDMVALAQEFLVPQGGCGCGSGGCGDGGCDSEEGCGCEH